MSIVSKDDVDKTVSFLYNRQTRMSYSSALADFVGIELEPAQVQKVISTWGNFSKSTITVRMAALAKLVEYKFSIGECKPINLKKLIVPEGRPSKKRRSLTDEELRRFIKAAKSTEEKLLTFVLFDTGIRAGFLPNIRYKDLQAESFRLVGKNQADVEYFPTEAMSQLAGKMMKLTGASGDDFLFTSGGGPASYKFVLRSFRRIAKRAGIEGITPHSARHTFATRLAAAGTELPSISALMGHKNVETTMRYVHPNRGTMQNAIHNIALSRSES